MTISATRQLVNFASTLSAPAIPAPLRRKIRLHLLDALACGWAASGHRVSEPMIRASRLFGGNGHCSVFGESGFSPLAAAFANAAMINGPITMTVWRSTAKGSAIRGHTGCRRDGCA